MDDLKLKYTKRLRSREPSEGTKCTRDEDLNIDEFMREDMREINL
jgi:hypothetical protein